MTPRVGHGVARTTASMRDAVTRLVTFVSLVLALAGCGGGVQLLDVQDPTLPMETRRWLADAEDGVIVARATRDRARRELADVEAWQERTESEINWPSNGAAAERALEQLADARVTRAELNVELQDALVTLAQAKHILAHAERAVLHDLAQYDLVPLRKEVDDARQQSDALGTRVRQAQAAEERSAAAWWQAYAAYVTGGGDRAPLWLVGRERVHIQPTPPAQNGGANAGATQPANGAAPASSGAAAGTPAATGGAGATAGHGGVRGQVQQTGPAVPDNPFH